MSGREHQDMSTLRASDWPPISGRGKAPKGALRNLNNNSYISVNGKLCLLLLPRMKQRACVALSSRTFLLLDSGKLNIKSLIVINAERG